MVKRNNILTAILKALLAGMETSAFIKIPSAFIAELASQEKGRLQKLNEASPEQFEELLIQLELSTTNAALTAVSSEQIKKLVSNLIDLTDEKLQILTELTQREFNNVHIQLTRLDNLATETNKGVKKLIQHIECHPKINNILQQLNSFSKLFTIFRKELHEKTTTEDNHPVLDHYSDNVDDEIIGLEKKLEKAEINDKTIKKAMSVKEIFSKKLARRRFYKSGQEIYSELMNQLFLEFNARVVPLINANASESEINSETSIILNEMVAKVGDNLDLINSQQIEGILYYLTGNCHIQWHKE